MSRGKISRSACRREPERNQPCSVDRPRPAWTVQCRNRSGAVVRFRSTTGLVDQPVPESHQAGIGFRRDQVNRIVVLKANQLPAFIPRSRGQYVCSSDLEFRCKKVDEAADRRGQPATRRKDGVDNSARQRPVREDDVQRAGRDLIHHNVVRELRNANAVRRKAYMSSAAYRGSSATLTRWPAASRNSQAWLGGARKRSSPGSRLNSAGVVGRPSWQGGTPDQELPTLGEPLHDQSLVLEGWKPNCK